MIEVKKKDRETSENLIRRFTRRIQQSGVLMQVRRNRFRNEGKSKMEKKNEVLYKIKIRKEIDKLKKVGKFDEDSLADLKRKMNK